MLDIDQVLNKLLGVRGLVAHLPQLREPCTCGAGLRKCPACVAWDRRYAVTPCLVTPPTPERHMSPPDPVPTLSDEAFAALKRRIRLDSSNLRVLQRRLRRQGTLSPEDRAEMVTTIAVLTINRQRRDAHAALAKKGRYHPTHAMD